MPCFFLPLDSVSSPWLSKFGRLTTKFSSVIFSAFSFAPPPLISLRTSLLVFASSRRRNKSTTAMPASASTLSTLALCSLCQGGQGLATNTFATRSRFQEYPRATTTGKISVQYAQSNGNSSVLLSVPFSEQRGRLRRASLGRAMRITSCEANSKERVHPVNCVSHSNSLHSLRGFHMTRRRCQICIGQHSQRLGKNMR